jgi:F-type H+-transporting ATPase subunit delta
MSQIDRTAIRYARALYQLAQAEGQAERVRADLGDLSALVRGSPDLARFISSHWLPPAQRRAALAQLFESRAAPLTFRFLLLLEHKRRTARLPDICRAYDAICDTEAGVLKARITGAQPLPADQFDAIRQRLERRLGQRVQAESAVDPSLIGGFRIQVGDALLDFSIAAQLNLLRKCMLHT